MYRGKEKEKHRKTLFVMSLQVFLYPGYQRFFPRLRRGVSFLKIQGLEIVVKSVEKNANTKQLETTQTYSRSSHSM